MNTTRRRRLKRWRRVVRLEQQLHSIDCNPAASYGASHRMYRRVEQARHAMFSSSRNPGKWI